MLSVHAISHIGYYVDEDYYLTDDQPVGIWIGRGAIALGISGRDISDEYNSIMRGFAPNGKTPLCSVPGESHQPGWDLTFSAPKSVSIVWAAADHSLREKISDAQLVAVKRAISFLENHAAFTRREHAGQRRERVDGLVVATFEHETSRDLDPQLHTHALVANVAPRSDGSWGTIISRDLYLWQKAAGATYRAELAYQINLLGLAVEPDGESFCLPCIPDSISHYFSKRAHAITESLTQTSATSCASSIGDRAKLVTRRTKQRVERSALLERWQSELDGFGLTAKYIESQSGHRLAGKPVVEPLFFKGIYAALTERVAVFRAQDLYQLVAEKLQCFCLPAAEIQTFTASLLADDELIPIGIDEKHSQLFTTRQMLRVERELVDVAKVLFTRNKLRLTTTSLQTAITLQEKSCGYQLTQEQRVALMDICCNGDLAILQGSAGAGKSSTMAVLRHAYQSSNHHVIGASIAKRAADNLQEESGIPSFTVAKLLNDSERGRNNFSTADVLVIDEAGQIGTRQLHSLLHIAAENNVKVILVGEDKQLDAIEHGGCLRYLSRQLNCSRIETIKRQRESWAREAVMQLRDGKAKAALEAFQQRGLLNFCSNAHETKSSMVHSWNQFRLANPERSTLLLAQKWADVNLLSNQVRTILQAEGSVGLNEVEVDCIVSEHRCKYKFAAGDRIKFCKNDYRLQVSNGTFGTIRYVKANDGRIDFGVDLNDGRYITFNNLDYKNEDGRLPISLGYALTVYASQGITIDGDVFVCWTNGMDRANSYVAGSRHKDNCHWFFNNQEVDTMTVQHNELNNKEVARINAIAKVMSFDLRKNMAMDYISNDENGNVKAKSHIIRYLMEK
ncbi:MobF family relaxase [Aeromonas sp. 75A]|uniref:MobF family relaxase n=1 Tax=unclassified Aeromonas TaxID=257493 RepID=UPI002E7BCDD3|nr:MobF family relaxase [Aeromonas sp. 43P]MEE1953582.1 MobF family relaxase [Aeromonas sp. 43P]